jgi:SP family xylose:H+ symportor-like MFS transporter
MNSSLPSHSQTNIHHPANLSYLLPICFVATLGGLLFGYDTGVISGAIDPMKAKFSLDSIMVGWVSSCVILGCAAGVLMVGPLSDRFGRKLAMFLAAIIFLISSIGTSIPAEIAAFIPGAVARFFCSIPSFVGLSHANGLGTTSPEIVGTFVLFRLLGGLAIGIASITTPMYIAEITPGNLRGRMVATNQIAIVGGFVATALINYYIAKSHEADPDAGLAWLNEHGWRWMFATGIFPAALFALLIFFIPESPRWLVERKREDKARAIMGKVGGDRFAAEELASIRSALATETGKWSELFSKTLMIPMVLGVLLAALQQVTGINVFLYFGKTIFEEMSKSTGVNAGLLTQIIINGSCALFTIVAIATVDKWGRKPLMISGALGMFVSLVSIGLLAQFTADPKALGYWPLLPTIVYIGCFGLSVGPVTWVILSEIYPTAVRGRALGLATCVLWLSDFVVTMTFPMMKDSAYLIAKFQNAFPFYVYAFFCIVLLVVMKFVPETKGRSLEEIERSWTEK